MVECFKCGQIWRGLLHDNSKFGVTEFISSAKNFQGTRSPIEAEKEKYGYSIAWQHHKGHNPHHWEYWIDNVGTRQNTPIKMPYLYVIEMLCDWVGAGKVYGKGKWDCHEPYRYYLKMESERIFHSETEAFVKTMLRIMSDDGMKEFHQKARSWATKFLYEHGGYTASVYEDKV